MIQVASSQGSGHYSIDTLCIDLIGEYQFTPKGGGKKFQILPKGDERK